jgi:hypothetical protein
MTKRPISLGTRASTEMVEVAQLGGLTLYSRSDADYAESFATYMGVLNEVIAEAVLLTRNTLMARVSLRLRPVPERKVQQAMLGAFLRLGRGDSIGCTSVNRRYYTTVIHESRISQLTHLVRQIKEESANSDEITYQRVSELLSSQEGGAALHVMAHAVYLGVADYRNRWCIGRPILEA